MRNHIIHLLRRHRVSLSKRLGQHLLVEPAILERIVEASGVGPEWDVVEIGAGVGNLTALLAETGARVVGVELDERFRAIHGEIFGPWKELRERVQFHYGDALEYDYAEAARRAHEAGRRFAVVGNIPYHLTSPLVAKLVLGEIPFDAMTILVQREVGERLAAHEGGRKSGAITVKVQFFCEVRSVFDVGRRAFLPPPDVESQLLSFRRHAPLLPSQERPRFFSLVEAAFAQRRKMLCNAVAAAGLGYSKFRVERALEQLGLPSTVRAEQLGVDLFVALYEKLLSHERES